MKFDIYGRFQLIVLRSGAGWEAYREVGGKRVRMHDLVLPPDLDASEIAVYLDDLLHELSPPGGRIAPV
ncbi:hypothetical protein [Bordetella sp. BOR01]|uniref:DUF7661 family protein n=1 Tax=Bordetella sp. BOR01 TaxID=2854779 RepID=UPI001C4413DB|nr:hypothetical protein [Bordetella sp. BOR01]MBV7483937.1 hypothetical protein [Bordetella sp. BOR01]